MWEAINSETMGVRGVREITCKKVKKGPIIALCIITSTLYKPLNHARSGTESVEGSSLRRVIRPLMIGELMQICYRGRMDVRP
jgi:hypothetical protein